MLEYEKVIAINNEVSKVKDIPEFFTMSTNGSNATLDGVFTADELRRIAAVIDALRDINENKTYKSHEHVYKENTYKVKYRVC